MSRRNAQRVLWLLFGISLIALLALLPADAWARLGGGQSFSGGGRRSSGGGGGGGGGAGDLIFLLIQLAIEVPVIGVPLLLLFVAFLIFRFYMASRGGGQRSVHRSHRARGPRLPRRVPGLDVLRQADEGFSLPVLYDFIQLVHARSYAALGSGKFQALAPFLSEDGVRALQGANPSVTAVSELVLGGLHVERVLHRSAYRILVVQLESSRLEAHGDNSRRVFVKELWSFRRASAATSIAPEATLSLTCPSCGSPVETDAMGACRNCDTPITKGQLQWQAFQVELRQRTRVSAPEVGFVAGGDEPSVSWPTLSAPSLAADLRAFRGRHPDFDPSAFDTRVAHAYQQLQAAWSAGRWDDARPYVTDAMFGSLRFWIERYTRHGLRNQLSDVQLQRTEIVNVQLDAWYESITMRIWGSMKDAILDKSGKVVGGNAKRSRNFSEYWTFLRAAGTGASSSDPTRCPSCGAPLDNINAAGVCGYCDALITSGRFDWVLSRIDQCEVYRG